MKKARNQKGLRERVCRMFSLSRFLRKHNFWASTVCSDGVLAVYVNVWWIFIAIRIKV